MRRVLWLFVTCFTAMVLAVGASAGPGDVGLVSAQTAQPKASHPSAGFIPAPSQVALMAEPLTDSLAALVPINAREVLEAIQKRHGEPLPGYVGGTIFHNRERTLPPGRYREYDVHPRIPGRNRGPERVVIEQGSGKAYYTSDHYITFIPMN